MKGVLRIAGVMAALVVPVSALSLTLATPAGAQPPSPYSVACAKIVITSSTATASKCKNAGGAPAWTALQKKASKKLVSTNPDSLASGGTLTWNGGGTVTIAAPSSVKEIGCTPSSNLNCTGYPSTTACKAPSGGYSSELQAVGTATATPPSGVTATTPNTSPGAPNVAAVGDSFEATICINYTASGGTTVNQAKHQDVYF